MKYVKSSFIVNFDKLGYKVAYSVLNDGRYMRTFLKDNEMEHEVISAKEYTSAITFTALNVLYSPPDT